LWDAAVVFSRKFLELNADGRKEEKSKITNLNSHLMKLEKGVQIKSDVGRKSGNNMTWR
jgi:hypothetical protein